MAMVQATLAAALVLPPTFSQFNAILAITSGFRAYAAGATALSPILATGLDAAQADMVPALVGMNTPGAGASLLAAAIHVFWATIVLPPYTQSFAGALAILPPGTSLTAAPLQAVFDAATAGRWTAQQVGDALAAVIHPTSILGGRVTTPGAPVVVTPIV